MVFGTRELLREALQHDFKGVVYERTPCCAGFTEAVMRIPQDPVTNVIAV